MKKFKAWIMDHEILSFFLLTYLITWGVWIPLIRAYFTHGSEVALVPMSWGLFGPALAGIVLTRLRYPGSEKGRVSISSLAFFLGWVLSALVWIGFVCLGSQTANNPGILLALIIFGALISLPPAYVIGSAFGRNPSVRAYLHSLVRPRGAWIYYLIAMFLPLILYWLGTQLSHLLDLPVYWSPIGLRGWRGAGTLALALGNQFIFANVLGEEVGWRGFALPRLQNRYSPLMASLVLAPLWFAWHLPLKLGNPDILPMLYYALSFLPSTLFLTWLYNRSQGSILVVGLAHVAGNLCGKYLFPISVGTLLVRFVLVVILIFIDQMWRKLSEHHPGVHRLFDEIEL